MQDNTSPEERLLRLIRGERRKSSRKDEKIPKDIRASQSEEGTQQAPVLRKKWHKKLSLSGNFNLSKIKEYLSFNQINRILLEIFLVLGVYLLVGFLITSPGKIEKRILALAPLDIKHPTGLGKVKGKPIEIPEKTDVTRTEPVSHYTQSVKSRNLFTATGLETRPVRLSPTFLEMVSKLKLQGIISGPNPQAVIEDTKAKQVYFLSPGERIGEIELKEILPGKVKLNYYGQEAELPL